MGDAPNPAAKARALSAAGLSLFCAAAFIFAAGPSLAAPPCKPPEELAAPANEAIPFKQTRILKGMSKPIVSQGEMIAHAGEIEWRVLKPVEIVTRVSSQGVTQSVAGGRPEPVGKGESGAFLAETGLSDLLRQDFSKVKQHYLEKREERKTPPGWSIKLTPKDKRLAPHLSAIALETCQRVEWIEILQANGDKFRVDFSEPK